MLWSSRHADIRLQTRDIIRGFRVVAATLVITALVALLVPVASVDAAAPKCKGKAATVPGALTGTEGDDVIIGTNGPDVIKGLGGNDLICALDGDDDFCIILFSLFQGVVAHCGTADGGSGDDHVQVTNEDDKAIGGSGSDTLIGLAPTNQLLDCGSGNDVVVRSANDTVRRCETDGIS